MRRTWKIAVGSDGLLAVEQVANDRLKLSIKNGTQGTFELELSRHASQELYEAACENLAELYPNDPKYAQGRSEVASLRAENDRLRKAIRELAGEVVES